MKIDKKNSSLIFIFMKKLAFPKKRLKKGFSLHFLQNLSKCPGSVVAYHASLSSSRPGSESRPGRYFNFFQNSYKKTKTMQSMKNILTIILSIFLFLNILTMISPDVDAQEIITVGSGGPPIYDFSKIADAITFANESDIIHVYNGTYSENIVINKTITLIGEGVGSTIILSANPNKNTIEVLSNYTNISGFTIKNLGGSHACLQLNLANFCQIYNNRLENGENSIYLINSNDNEIKDNTVENNKNGIYLWTSNNNTIRNNKIQNNDIYGVFISSASSENTIFLNDFSKNFGANSRDDGNNNWNDSAQGNFWDDYNDYDENKDGIGDNPYLISGSGGNQDFYPLGDFLSASQPVAYIDFISPNPAPKKEPISFSGHGSSPDGIIEAYEWKSDNIQISSSESFSSSTLQPGTHTISFRVKDDKGTWSEKVYETLIINPNQKPNAYILNPSGSAIFGETVNFSGYGVDPDGEIIGYSWRSTPSFITNTNSSFTLDDLPVENYTIYFKVKDDENQWSIEASTTLSILPNTTQQNAPPVADAKGPYIGLVNQSINFDASLSFDSDAEDTLFYNWDFGDGATSKDQTTDHIYNASGNYTVELTVTDSHGLASINSTYAIVNNKPDDQNNGLDKGTPGFEIIFVFIAISLVLILRKKNNKKRRS